MKHRRKTIPRIIGKKKVTVFDAIFLQQVDVLLNYSPKDYEGWLNRNSIKDITQRDFTNFQAWTSEYEDENGLKKSLVVLPQFNWAIKHQGSLIHEITHVIVKIWNRNSIPFNADTQEFLAHSIGNMYEDIALKLLTYKR